MEIKNKMKTNLMRVHLSYIATEKLKLGFYA
jgi:hypothetical protein